MDPERWRRIEGLYHEALQKKSEEREAYLDAACAGDLPLRQEVERLLAFQSEGESFMESPRSPPKAGPRCWTSAWQRPRKTQDLRRKPS